MKTSGYFLFALALILCAACSRDESQLPGDIARKKALDADDITLEGTARLISALPLDGDNLREVYDAVGSSSANGYDEEYMLSDLLTSPGKGVGDRTTKAGGYPKPMRSLIEDYLKENMPRTKSLESDVRGYLDALSSSGMQIYWPFSEDWDGKTFPVITFDPGYGAETNYGFFGSDSLLVDENLARSRPVWVINSNDDSSCKPVVLFERGTKSSGPVRSGKLEAGRGRTLLLKSFKMLRNYDSWFAGASEFKFKCGSVEGFNASTEAELSLYQPTITDFTLIIKRKQVGQEVPFNSIIMTDFTNQLEKLALLITEDDGGTRTGWKCSASVKIQSKTYGFDIELPYNDRDDIVWRGQVAAGYFQEEDTVTGRFGDVVITFELL